ncbi:chloride channel protein [Entomobacter blattae]|nr:chloride channel protein [Entomobacter blattae]
MTPKNGKGMVLWLYNLFFYKTAVGRFLRHFFRIRKVYSEERVSPFLPGGWMLCAPQTIRAMVRRDEIWITALAAVIGALAGLVVVCMNVLVRYVHRVLFDLHDGNFLSGQSYINPWRSFLIPTLGGLLLGVLGVAFTKIWPGRRIDPVEANALHGGRMSIRDSLIVVVQTLVSNGAGGSIGLESGFTQLSAAFGSRIGHYFRVRRWDLRLMVGCGAAGGIGAAFGAPLAGAFYAFELIMGTYSLSSLPPVATASICAILVTSALHHTANPVFIMTPQTFPLYSYFSLIGLGLVTALVGILVMWSVTVSENIFRKIPVPGFIRPMIGGAIVGSLGTITPAVLSSGHAALRIGLDGGFLFTTALLVLVLKILAVSISIGSGFRGGLFFASLFLGVLTGIVYGHILAFFGMQPLSGLVYALVGMSSMAVAVIGGPMTMVFLALEMTGNLPLTIAVLIAAVMSSLTVRRLFGYSFATWRFHLRGENIRSAVDVSWLRQLTVGHMMRKGFHSLSPEVTIAEARRAFPLGSDQFFVLEEAGMYTGIVYVPELYLEKSQDLEKPVSLLARNTARVLLPQMNVKEAIAAFEAAESDVLVVVENQDTMQVIGSLTEQYTLKRYSEELDKTRRELAGDVGP